MKSFFILSSWLFCLSSSRFGTTVDAACLGTCNEVNSNSSCSEAFAFALAGNISAATSVLRYGRYCGNNNECDVADEVPPGEEDSVCLFNTTDCPPDSCDAVDEACRQQDLCLDGVQAANPNVTTIGYPERCACDVQFVAANARTVSNATAPLGNCEDAFYNVSVVGSVTPIDLVEHEATLMSAGFCCDVVSTVCAQDAQANGYSEAYALAVTLCRQLLNGLAEDGVNLCGDIPPPEICYLCGDETMYVANTEALLLTTSFTCGEAEQAGLAGLIPETQCDQIQANLNFVAPICGCTLKEGLTMPPTESPTGPDREQGTEAPSPSTNMPDDATNVLALTMTTTIGLIVASLLI